METIRGAIAGVIALIACPCHLPITLPIFLALTSGTALGLWLASNQWVVWLVSSIIFLAGLGVAAYWFYRADKTAQCELPAQKQPPKVSGRRGASSRS